MIIQPNNVDEIRRVVAVGHTANIKINPTGFTLGAMLEVACARTSFKRRNISDAASLIDTWRITHSILDLGLQIIEGATAPRPAPFSAPTIELYAIGTRSDLGDNQNWLLFGDRFRRSLVNHGFDRNLASGLAGAMVEMTDNVAIHSGADEDHPARGIVGYHVSRRWMSFSVVDIGRGVLASLHQNPHWKHLTTSIEALRAAIYQHASRRIDWQSGNGFRQVLQSIGNLNGELRFRSGNGVLTLDGRGADLHVVAENTEPMEGLQLTITCSLDQNAAPRPAAMSSSHEKK